MQLVNYAAWIPHANAALEVGTAPFPADGKDDGTLGDDDLVIKNAAVAINPVDWKLQSAPGNPFGLSYPYILGEDVAGQVIEVGKNVSHVKVGDRVIAHALGLGAGDPAYGGFQLYPKVKRWTVARIPDRIDGEVLKFEDAVVLPLSISTAAAGLYLKGNLGLRLPEVGNNREGVLRPTGSKDEKKNKGKETLLLWGGSSSVGSSVVQLAVASGYDVVATASPANYSYVKALGAKLVLDYHNPDIVDILIELLKDTQVVGAYDSIGSDTTVRQSAEVLHALGGGKVASVVSAPTDVQKNVTVTRIGSGNIVSQEDGIVAKKVWTEFVGKALEKAILRPEPEALVIGKGLYFVQGGLDRQKAGVSAKKVVVTL